MELELSEDQEFFRATTRKFLEAEAPLTVVRELAKEADGFDREFWRRGAELGWTSMLVSEADGGGTLSGAGLLDLMLVAEEMGRLVTPGPLLPTNVVAGALSTNGTDEQRSHLASIVSGESVAAWAMAEPASAVDPSAMTCTAVRSGDGFTITGTKTPVEAGAQADLLLVVAMTDEGPTQFVVPADAPGVSAVALGSIDLVKRFAEVTLDGVVVPASAVLGEVGAAREDIEHQLQTAIVLQCAETCGAMARVLEFTLEYLDDRFSFGRPLSSYQALKHRCADMKLWLEASCGTTSAAARAVQARADDATEIVSAAKSYVASAATELIQDCVQLHGGIGVTWEHDIHLYLRRATLNRGLHGSPADHRERIAVLLGMGPLTA